MKHPFLLLIRFYQYFISPMFPNRNCKYYPTCSDYASQALNNHNIFKAMLLIIWRITRCNPFSGGGYDPVKKAKKKVKKDEY